MNTRTTGLLIAFAFALITIGVVLFVYIRYASAPVAQPVAPVVAAEEQIQALGTSGPLQSGGKGRIQGTAKDDPEREVYDFTYERIDPKPGGVYDVESPAGWIYLEDGHGIYVRAERGQVVAPSPAGSEVAGRPALPTDPEKGNLAGDVVIRLFADVNPRAPIDPETTEPLGTFETDVLRFNALTGELSTPEEEEISVETPDFKYRGTYLRAKFDEVRSRFFVRVERRHQLEYVQANEVRDQEEKSAAASPEPPLAGDKPTEGAAPGAEVADAEAPKTDLYHCVLAGDLLVQQVGQGRWLKADRLQLWARLVDGRLPEGAIAPLAFGDPEKNAADLDDGRSDGADTAPSPDADIATADDPGPATTIPLTDTPPDEPNVITLTWNGPLVLSPMDDVPAELEEDDAAMRFSAMNGNRVLLTDDGDGTVQCAMLEYGATTRRVMVSNQAPSIGDLPGARMDAVAMNSQEHGVLRGSVIHADLTTGLASIDGAGTLLPAAGEHAERPGRRIEWAERADFTFRTAAGRVLGSLEEALLTGLVEATDGRASLTADSVRVRFARTEPDAAGRRADVLSRLIADGNVVADGGVDDRGREVGRIAAAHMDVEFDPADAGTGAAEDGNPTPRVIDARGADGGALVVTERQGERLECARLLAHTARDGDGRLIVTTVNADGDVAVWREDGIEARAGRMEADGRTQVAELFDDVTLSRRGEGGAVIHGQQARVGGEDRVIEVFGPGNFEFESAAGEDGQAPGRLTATWTKEMRFNDATGVIDCLGGVVATNHASALETDLLQSHRVVIQLADAEEGAAAAGTEAMALDGRRVKHIEAIGESLEVAGGEMATAELRRYVADATAPDGRRIERFARLKGDRILASEVDGTLIVPGPGDAALYDARAVAAAADDENKASGLLPGPGQIRGATLFRWEGSLKGDRNEGTLLMKRGVEMVHKPLEEEQRELLLVCEELETRVEEAAASSAATSAEEERKISQVRAEGAVYVRADRPGTSMRQELIADRLIYDAATGMLRASASEGNRVTLFDVMRGAPIVAKVLEWDLVRDVITVQEMSTVSSPVAR